MPKKKIKEQNCPDQSGRISFIHMESQMPTTPLPPVYGVYTSDRGKRFVIYVTGQVVDDELSHHPRFVGARFNVQSDAIESVIVDNFELHSIEENQPWPWVLAGAQQEIDNPSRPWKRV